MTATRKTKTMPVADIVAYLRAAGLVHNGCVWVTCHNCGGTGDYPSSCLPPGRCRLYCWKDRTPETYGKHATSVTTVAKRIQRYQREEIRWHEDAPKREQQMCEEAARREQRAQEYREAEERREAERAEKLAKMAYVGRPGERIETEVTCEKALSFEGAYGWFAILLMRDRDGNRLVYKGSAPPLAEGESATIRATVKDHDTYNDERQTIIQRIAVATTA